MDTEKTDEVINRLRTGVNTPGIFSDLNFVDNPEEQEDFINAVHEAVELLSRALADIEEQKAEEVHGGWFCDDEGKRILESVTKRLYGNGSEMTGDQRRDLANTMDAFLHSHLTSVEV